jgi:hypothetical protein
MDSRLRELQRLVAAQPDYVNTQRYIRVIFRSGNSEDLLEALHLATPSVFLSNGSLLIRVKEESFRGRRHYVISPTWIIYRVIPRVSNLLSGREAFSHLYPHFFNGDVAVNPHFCSWCQEPITGQEYGDEQWGYFYYQIDDSPDLVRLHGQVPLELGDTIPDPILTQPNISGCLRQYLDSEAKLSLTSQEEQNLLDTYILQVLETIVEQPEECLRPINNMIELGLSLGDINLSQMLFQEQSQTLSPAQITIAFINHHNREMEKLIKALNLACARYFYEVRVDLHKSVTQEHYVILLKNKDGKNITAPIPKVFERTGMLTCSAQVELNNLYIHMVEGQAIFSVTREINYDFLSLTNQGRLVTIPIAGLAEPLNISWLADQRTERIEDHRNYNTQWSTGDTNIRLSWPIGSLINELIAKIEEIPPPDIVIDAALKHTKKAAQAILNSIIQNNDPEDYDPEDSEILSVVVARDHEQEHYPGPIACRPCFQISAHTDKGIVLYTDTEALSKDLDAWGVSRWEYWIIEVAKQIDLTQMKYWYEA